MNANFKLCFQANYINFESVSEFKNEIHAIRFRYFEKNNMVRLNLRKCSTFFAMKLLGVILWSINSQDLNVLNKNIIIIDYVSLCPEVNGDFFCSNIYHWSKWSHILCVCTAHTISIVIIYLEGSSFWFAIHRVSNWKISQLYLLY